MRYDLRQEKFHEENTGTLRIFFSAHPASLRDLYFGRTRITQMKRMLTDFYQFKSIQSVSSVFQCCHFPCSAI